MFRFPFLVYCHLLRNSAIGIKANLATRFHSVDWTQACCETLRFARTLRIGHVLRIVANIVPKYGDERQRIAVSAENGEADGQLRDHARNDVRHIAHTVDCEARHRIDCGYLEGREQSESLLVDGRLHTSLLLRFAPLTTTLYSGCIHKLTFIR